jgi:hypothetical protein
MHVGAMIAGELDYLATTQTYDVLVPFAPIHFIIVPVAI